MNYDVEPERTIQIYTCPLGYSVAVFRFQNEIVRVNGVVEHESNSSSPSFKKNHKDRKLKLPLLTDWLKRAGEAAEILENEIQVLVNEKIHALHDIKSLIGNILRASENWMWEQPGISLAEKVDNSHPEARKIYQCSRILETLLQMTDIIANPDVAAYGQPRPTSIYGVLFMLSKVYADKAASRGVDLSFRGSSNNQPKLYNSFIVIPLVLIDNAVKYADPKSKILITINDNGGGVTLHISSQGELVPQAERKNIFSRGVRGSNTKAPGSGIGLFIATLVASVNGIDLRYVPTELDSVRGYNCFTCQIPPVAPRNK